MIKTDKNFWDCNCEKDYIQPKSEPSCFDCGAKAKDQPDSHVSEIKASRFK
jgi:hypothetical protein